MVRDQHFETYREILVNGSPNFLIFVHGSWAVRDNDLNVEASKAIAAKGLASMLLYDSRREWRVTQKPDVTQEEWVRAFDGKTYQDELQELRAYIDYAREKYQPENLFLSGRSYGGGLVALVSGDNIPELKRVLLFSPEIESPYVENPPNIYQGFPHIDEFLLAIKRYKKRLTIVHGENDDVVPFEHSDLLYQVALTRQKNLIKVVGADHSFSGSALEEYVKAHLIAFG